MYVQICTYKRRRVNDILKALKIVVLITNSSLVICLFCAKEEIHHQLVFDVVNKQQLTIWIWEFNVH